MDIPEHPSVDELLAVIRTRGGTIACSVCSRQEFSLEQTMPMAASGGYGEQREKRTDLICENCGHVMGFELKNLRSSSL